MPVGTKSETRFAFTRPRLLDLNPPTADRVYYYDLQTPSLACCITSAGSRTFYVYRKVNRRPVRIRLGRVNELTVDDARKLALRHVADMNEGKDPQEVRRARREEATFGELFTHWLEHWAKPRLRTWQESKRQYDTLLASWANRRLSTIKETDVAALHTRLGRDHGNYAANRAFALVKALFGKKAGAANAVGFRGRDPTIGVARFPEYKRDRFLQADELPKFFDALAQEPNGTLRDFFLTCLLVGARRQNVMQMKWCEIDLKGAMWRIPHSKRGEPHTVPLTPPLVKLLSDRKAIAHCKEYVFPGRYDGHLTNASDAWQRLRTRAKLPDLRIHDLRRSLGSWQAMAGSSLTVIGKSLGHTQPSTTAIYARLQLDTVRQSIDAAAALMLTAGGLLQPKVKRTRNSRGRN